MQALVTALEARAFEVNATDDGVRVTILDKSIGFAIQEETKKVEHRISFTEQKLIDRGLGAVILFSRNITGGPQEVAELVAQLKHRAADRRLLVAIDHEGGRVARMRLGFSPIPSMRDLGRAIEASGTKTAPCG